MAIEPIRAVVPILAFRFFPFAGYVAITRNHSWVVRGVVVAVYACISLVATRAGGTSPLWMLLAYAYFSAAGCVAYELSPHVCSRTAWFALLTVVFWGLPLAAIHPLPTVFLVLGWDVILSAYSYGVETRRSADRSLGAFLFFLLINPALVYSSRGRRSPARGPAPRTLLRVAMGIGAVLLAATVLEPLHARAVASRPSTILESSLLFLPIGASRLAGEYAAQSGVASIQIGVMRHLGYELPERFRFPILARSPADFWRRWNTYVGDWARIYVFLPLIRALSRRSRSRRLRVPLGYAVSVVFTFVIVGVLHDAFVVAESGSLQMPATTWFAAAGVVVVVWEALSGRLRGSDGNRTGGSIERALFTVVATCAAARLWW